MENINTQVVTYGNMLHRRCGVTDIRKYPQIIEAINAVLNAEGIAEVKWEKTGLTVVQIKRTLVTPRKDKN